MTFPLKLSGIFPVLLIVTSLVQGTAFAFFGDPPKQEKRIGALVQFRGDLSAIEALGGRIRGVLGDVAAIEIPRSNLNELSSLPQILRVRRPRRLRPLLDQSVTASGANARDVVWSYSSASNSFSGNTGQNVVFGIVDSGIDLQHMDFRGPDGQSRILFLWDQTQSGFLRFPPPNMGYGMECTRSGIVFGGCPERDEEGHGTHVSGIAAGNGSATGNGYPAYRYIGVAPEADLIVVKTDFFEDHILDGISYIQQKAAALGKPYVINLSLGSHIDPHDGTSLFARALNNASGPGRIIVAAMGNEGDVGTSPIHVSGTVGSGNPVTVSFTVPSSLPETPLLISIWYPGANQFQVNVQGPGLDCIASLSAPVAPSDPDTATVPQTTCGPIFLGSSFAQSTTSDPAGADNDDREIFLALGNNIVPPKAGSWTFQLIGTAVGANGRFDAWTEDAIFAGTAGTTLPGAGNYVVNPETTMVDSASAAQVISVGSYVTRNTWPHQGGGSIPPTNSTVSDLSFFSSQGPTRPCSNGAACPSVQKPDLVAPGEWIMSSRSAQFSGPGCSLSLTLLDCFEPDGVHMVFRGTSMAAPHVAGAVAMILQWHPDYTPDQVKALLRQNVQQNSFSAASSPPNNRWGYGILD
ncbi:MAG TPA: S8 family serine peptidase, partial [Nitrospiria bacterium]|nr:S8 family serine peptidase [Nitrospiria bacterium]